MPELTDPSDDTTANAETEAAAQEWAESFHDKPLVVNLSARVPEGRLKTLLIDPPFKETWFRQRLDLPDQSQESYDLALACFGLSARVNEQEIIDLVVHHRAQHKQKQRSTLDYFRRLISKAASNTGVNDPGKSTGPGPSAGPSSTASDPSSTAAPDPDAAAKRAAICKSLSGVLGVQIHSITKISGQCPIFYMDLAEGKAAFSNISKLISQNAARNELAAITGKLMRKFKSKEWEKVAQALLDACTLQDGGEEMEMEGSARLRLAQYLAGSTFIALIEGQLECNARCPMVEGGSIRVCASDFQAFLSKTTPEKITIPAVVTMLYAVGAKIHRARGKFKEQSRWILPSSKFAPADYDGTARKERPDETH